MTAVRFFGGAVDGEIRDLSFFGGNKIKVPVMDRDFYRLHVYEYVSLDPVIAAYAGIEGEVPIDEWWEEGHRRNMEYLNQLFERADR